MTDRTPWQDWRALAQHALGWSPHAFWRATPHDLWAALSGRALLHPGLTAQAIAQLRTKLDEVKHG